MVAINLEKLQRLQKQKEKQMKKENEERRLMYHRNWKKWEQDRWQNLADTAEQQEAKLLKADHKDEHELQIFNFIDKNEVRVVMKGDTPWFVVKDVCDVLGLSNPTMALGGLDEDERSKFNLGRQGEVNIINESGLYVLISKSRKWEAKIFRRWITHDVIPSIRKHGAYVTPEKIAEIVHNPELLESLTPALNQALAEKVERDAPKVQLADSIIDSNATISINVLAKLLAKNGIDIGPSKLFDWMRRKGFLIKQKGRNWNVPKQEHIDSGILTTKISPVRMGDGIIMEMPTPLVTGKGQAYFINRFLSGRDGVVF